jgi:hypothetical protein
MDQSEMFVLMSLIHICLRCVFAPTLAMDRPTVPAQGAQRAARPAAVPQRITLAFIHAPTLRLIV